MRGGKVQVEVVLNVKGETIFERTIQQVKRESLVYIGRFQSWNGLVLQNFHYTT